MFTISSKETTKSHRCLNSASWIYGIKQQLHPLAFTPADVDTRQLFMLTLAAVPPVYLVLGSRMDTTTSIILVMIIITIIIMLTIKNHNNRYSLSSSSSSTSSSSIHISTYGLHSFDWSSGAAGRSQTSRHNGSLRLGSVVPLADSARKSKPQYFWKCSRSLIASTPLEGQTQ